MDKSWLTKTYPLVSKGTSSQFYLTHTSRYNHIHAHTHCIRIKSHVHLFKLCQQSRRIATAAWPHGTGSRKRIRYCPVVRYSDLQHTCWYLHIHTYTYCPWRGWWRGSLMQHKFAGHWQTPCHESMLHEVSWSTDFFCFSWPRLEISGQPPTSCPNRAQNAP